MGKSTGRGKKALVTGGAGFIGSHLVEALVKEGYRVHVLDNLSTGRLSNLSSVKNDIVFFEGDIRDGGVLVEAVKNCDVIFHEAAVVSVTQSVNDPAGTHDVNTTGTLTVLESAHRAGVKRVIFASSCAVYGDDPRLPKHEKMVPRPKSPYAVQKLTGELYARLYFDLYGIETVCLRYFNVYGPRQDASSPYSGVISIFITRATAGKPATIYGDGGQSRDFVFVKDVVRANLLAAEAESAGGEVINVATGQHIRIKSLWEMVCGQAGIGLVPEYQNPRPGDIIASVGSIDQAASLLAYRPEYRFEAGLRETFGWYKEQPPSVGNRV